MPETWMLELGWPLSEKAQADLDDKKRKPSKEIRIEAMRDAVDFSQRTSARGRGKAVLVYPAEDMNAFTANALLKTLEEPPGDVRFVLASEAAHQLLPTIRSRCLVHTMVWPDTGSSLAWLDAQGLDAAQRCLLPLHAVVTVVVRCAGLVLLPQARRQACHLQPLQLRHESGAAVGEEEAGCCNVSGNLVL
jgi:DNA polymerase-3 subunit delta'